MPPITNAAEAAFAVQGVASAIDDVLGNLAHGTYTNEVVSGVSGTASVAGEKYYYSGVDCGYDCVRSYNDTAIEIVFADYKAVYCDYDTCATTLSGTVTYTDDTWSRQQGSYYTSGGSVVMAGSDVSCYTVVSPGYIADWGYQDTISFMAGEEGYYGACTPSNGETYSW